MYVRVSEREREYIFAVVYEGVKKWVKFWFLS